MNFLALQRLLDTLLHTERFAATDDLNGVFLAASRPDAPLHRFGIALEPVPGLLAWVERERLDAIFLHRPWRLDSGDRQALTDAGIGVLAYHLAFDECLTTGFNAALAVACNWGEPALLAEKEGRPLGMICALPNGPVAFAAVVVRLEEEFGGLEEVVPPSGGVEALVGQVACVGAMNNSLVRAAHAAGAGLYITGQWRQPARSAVRETGIGVAAVGHRRSEEWGLRTLARLLRERTATAGLDVIEADGPVLPSR